jgi:hypothetical protein
MEAHLERCTGSSHTHDRLEPSWDVIASTMSTIANDWSATLFLERGEDDHLFLSASEGRYAVTIKRGADFFDLVGDPTLRGRTQFPFGGQAGEHPRRHVVPLALVLAAAKAFLGLAPDDDLDWERQGPREID